MGSSTYSSTEHATRTTMRVNSAMKTGRSVADTTFAYSADIRSGKTAAVVHPSLSPANIKLRESRDSNVNPEAVPIAITLDTTGSMAQVPFQMQADLSKLMGTFLSDRASGKKYLGENGSPAILISAVDDYPAGCRAGALQVGQFESGLEIDDNLTNLWITGNGGGDEPRESYILALYTAARHTAHDHHDKRGQKGCWFIIGDEKSYPAVSRAEIQSVFGVAIQEDQLTIDQLIAEASDLYNIFFIMPNQTNHWGDREILKFWKDRLPQGHVIELDDPTKICETIAGTVALCAETVTLDDLKADGVAVGGALTTLSRNHSGEVVRPGHFDIGGLPSIVGDAGSSERL